MKSRTVVDAMRITLVVGLLLALGAPAAEGEEMEERTVRELATRYTAAWCSQKPESVAAYFSPDGSLTINQGEASVGREAITEAARGFMTAFPDMVVTLDALERTADGWIYRWTLDGTNTGPEGTGKRVHISGYEEWSIGPDGLVARSLGHFDAAEYERQLREGAAD